MKMVADRSSSTHLLVTGTWRLNSRNVSSTISSNSAMKVYSIQLTLFG